MQNKRILRRQNGTTLIETMIAMVVFLIIMLGGIQYFFLPQTTMARQKFRRLAISAAKNRLESIRSMDYVQITTALNETNAPISLGDISGERSTTISLVDDPADGSDTNDKDGNLVDYKIMDVSVSWNIHKIRNVFLATVISDLDYYTNSDSTYLTIEDDIQEIYGDNCDNFKFKLVNDSDLDIDLTGIQLNWPAPVAYYSKIIWGDEVVFNSQSPRAGSGDNILFSNTKTLSHHSDIVIKIEKFRENQSGDGGDKINISDTTLTIKFSEISSFSINLNSCTNDVEEDENDENDDG